MKNINILEIVKISDICKLTGLTRRNVLSICTSHNVNVIFSNKRYYIDLEDYKKLFTNGCCEHMKEMYNKELERSKTTGLRTDKYKGRVREEDLTEEQRKRREHDRNVHKSIKNPIKGYGVLKYVSEYAKQLPYSQYIRERDNAYKRQMYRAFCGVKGNCNEDNFVYDIDLEKMYNDNYEQRGKIIKKWWKGEIRHWTVNDGVWKDGK